MTTRTPGRRALAVTAAVVTGAAGTLGVGALPAAAHPSFASSVQVGFQPNPAGGIGGTDVAPPYVSGSRPAMAFRLPYERGTEMYNGKPNTTIGASVTAPAGWADADCSMKPRTNISTPATQFTNQPGAEVDGWTCAKETIGTGSDARVKMSWSGPQADTVDGSAQFFIFKLTAPVVTQPTRYGAGVAGLAPGSVVPPAGSTGAAGFYSTQIYARSQEAAPPANATVYWIPPSDPAAYTPGSGGSFVSASNTATGLIRTVAPPGAATGSPANLTITATVTPGGGPGGEFTMTVPGNSQVAMTAGTPTSVAFPFAGLLNPVSLTDTRFAAPAWTINGIAADFLKSGETTPIANSARYVGWTPIIVTQIPGATATIPANTEAGTPLIPGNGATPGAAAAPYPGSATSSTNTGLSVSRALATAPAGHPTGTAVLGANITMQLPKSFGEGTFGTTLTMTAI